MKTIKVRVDPDSGQIARFEAIASELVWIWNLARSVALDLHCLDWYKYADKRVDLSGIVPCVLSFSQHSAWEASCEIAKGGPHWVRDEKLPPIPYQINGITKYKPAYRLVEGDRPRIPVQVLSFVPSERFPKVSSLDSKRNLDQVRVEQGLPPLTLHSDYIGGLLNDFKVTFEAYKSTKLKNRHKPRFKHLGDIATLKNDQNPPKIDFDANTIEVAELKGLKVCDRSWRKRIESLGYIPRTYEVFRRPSGWYVTISFAHPLQAEKSRLKNALKHKDADKESLKQAIAEIDEAIAASTRDPGKGLSAGIDPGINAIVATDHGALFQPNHRRERITIRLEKLQTELDRIININDARLGKERSPTKNEQKLRAQIARLHEKGANSANAFNHKLSSRLVRTFGAIAWEETQVSDLIKQVEPILAKDGVYLPNGASDRRDLNWKLRQRAIADLCAKTATKMAEKGRKFVLVPRAGTSEKCHCCGHSGKFIGYTTFVCQNPECPQYAIEQNRDVNAARNMRKCAGGEMHGEMSLKYGLKELPRRHCKLSRRKKIRAQ